MVDELRNDFDSTLSGEVRKSGDCNTSSEGK